MVLLLLLLLVGVAVGSDVTANGHHHHHRNNKIVVVSTISSDISKMFLMQMVHSMRRAPSATENSSLPFAGDDDDDHHLAALIHQHQEWLVHQIVVFGVDRVYWYFDTDVLNLDAVGAPLAVLDKKNLSVLSPTCMAGLKKLLATNLVPQDLWGTVNLVPLHRQQSNVIDAKSKKVNDISSNRRRNFAVSHGDVSLQKVLRRATKRMRQRPRGKKKRTTPGLMQHQQQQRALDGFIHHDKAQLLNTSSSEVWWVASLTVDDFIVATPQTNTACACRQKSGSWPALHRLIENVVATNTDKELPKSKEAELLWNRWCHQSPSHEHDGHPTAIVDGISLKRTAASGVSSFLELVRLAEVLAHHTISVVASKEKEGCTSSSMFQLQRGHCVLERDGNTWMPVDAPTRVIGASSASAGVIVKDIIWDQSDQNAEDSCDGSSEDPNPRDDWTIVGYRSFMVVKDEEEKRTRKSMFDGCNTDSCHACLEESSRVQGAKELLDTHRDLQQLFTPPRPTASGGAKNDERTTTAKNDVRLERPPVGQVATTDRNETSNSSTFPPVPIPSPFSNTTYSLTTITGSLVQWTMHSCPICLEVGQQMTLNATVRINANKLQPGYYGGEASNDEQLWSYEGSAVFNVTCWSVVYNQTSGLFTTMTDGTSSAWNPDSAQIMNITNYTAQPNPLNLDHVIDGEHDDHRGFSHTSAVPYVVDPFLHTYGRNLSAVAIGAGASDGVLSQATIFFSSFYYPNTNTTSSSSTSPKPTTNTSTTTSPVPIDFIMVSMTALTASPDALDANTETLAGECMSVGGVEKRTTLANQSGAENTSDQYVVHERYRLQQTSLTAQVLNGISNMSLLIQFANYSTIVTNRTQKQKMNGRVAEEGLQQTNGGEIPLWEIVYEEEEATITQTSVPYSYKDYLGQSVTPITYFWSTDCAMRGSMKVLTALEPFLEDMGLLPVHDNNLAQKEAEGDYWWPDCNVCHNRTKKNTKMLSTDPLRYPPVPAIFTPSYLSFNIMRDLNLVEFIPSVTFPRYTSGALGYAPPSPFLSTRTDSIHGKDYPRGPITMLQSDSIVPSDHEFCFTDAASGILLVVSVHHNASAAPEEFSVLNGYGSGDSWNSEICVSVNVSEDLGSRNCAPFLRLIGVAPPNSQQQDSIMKTEEVFKSPIPQFLLSSHVSPTRSSHPTDRIVVTYTDLALRELGVGGGFTIVPSEKFAVLKAYEEDFPGNFPVSTDNCQHLARAQGKQQTMKADQEQGPGSSSSSSSREEDTDESVANGGGLPSSSSSTPPSMPASMPGGGRSRGPANGEQQYPPSGKEEKGNTLVQHDVPFPTFLSLADAYDTSQANLLEKNRGLVFVSEDGKRLLNSATVLESYHPMGNNNNTTTSQREHNLEKNETTPPRGVDAAKNKTLIEIQEYQQQFLNNNHPHDWMTIEIRVKRKNVTVVRFFPSTSSSSRERHIAAAVPRGSTVTTNTTVRVDGEQFQKVIFYSVTRSSTLIFNRTDATGLVKRFVAQDEKRWRHGTPAKVQEDDDEAMITDENEGDLLNGADGNKKSSNNNHDFTTSLLQLPGHVSHIVKNPSLILMVPGPFSVLTANRRRYTLSNAAALWEAGVLPVGCNLVFEANRSIDSTPASSQNPNTMYFSPTVNVTGMIMCPNNKDLFLNSPDAPPGTLVKFALTGDGALRENGSEPNHDAKNSSNAYCGCSPYGVCYTLEDITHLAPGSNQSEPAMPSTSPTENEDESGDSFSSAFSIETMNYPNTSHARYLLVTTRMPPFFDLCWSTYIVFPFSIIWNQYSVFSSRFVNWPAGNGFPMLGTLVDSNCSMSFSSLLSPPSSPITSASTTTTAKKLHFNVSDILPPFLLALGFETFVVPPPPPATRTLYSTSTEGAPTTEVVSVTRTGPTTPSHFRVGRLFFSINLATGNLMPTSMTNGQCAPTPQQVKQNATTASNSTNELQKLLVSLPPTNPIVTGDYCLLEGAIFKMTPQPASTSNVNGSFSILNTAPDGGLGVVVGDFQFLVSSDPLIPSANNSAVQPHDENKILLYSTWDDAYADWLRQHRLVMGGIGLATILQDYFPHGCNVGDYNAVFVSVQEEDQRGRLSETSRGISIVLVRIDNLFTQKATEAIATANSGYVSGPVPPFLEVQRTTFSRKNCESAPYIAICDALSRAATPTYTNKLLDALRPSAPTTMQPQPAGRYMLPYVCSSEDCSDKCTPLWVLDHVDIDTGCFQESTSNTSFHGFCNDAGNVTIYYFNTSNCTGPVVNNATRVADTCYPPLDGGYGAAYAKCGSWPPPTPTPATPAPTTSLFSTPHFATIIDFVRNIKGHYSTLEWSAATTTGSSAGSASSADLSNDELLTTASAGDALSSQFSQQTTSERATTFTSVAGGWSRGFRSLPPTEKQASGITTSSAFVMPLSAMIQPTSVFIDRGSSSGIGDVPLWAQKEERSNAAQLANVLDAACTFPCFQDNVENDAQAEETTMEKINEACDLTRARLLAQTAMCIMSKGGNPSDSGLVQTFCSVGACGDVSVKCLEVQAYFLGIARGRVEVETSSPSASEKQGAVELVPAVVARCVNDDTMGGSRAELIPVLAGRSWNRDHQGLLDQFNELSNIGDVRSSADGDGSVFQPLVDGLVSLPLYHLQVQCTSCVFIIFKGITAPPHLLLFVSSMKNMILTSLFVLIMSKFYWTVRKVRVRLAVAIAPPETSVVDEKLEREKMDADCPHVLANEHEDSDGSAGEHGVLGPARERQSTLQFECNSNDEHNATPATSKSSRNQKSATPHSHSYFVIKDDGSDQRMSEATAKSKNDMGPRPRASSWKPRSKSILEQELEEALLPPEEGVVPPSPGAVSMDTVCHDNMKGTNSTDELLEGLSIQDGDERSEDVPTRMAAATVAVGEEELPQVAKKRCKPPTVSNREWLARTHFYLKPNMLLIFLESVYCVGALIYFTLFVISLSSDPSSYSGGGHHGKQLSCLTERRNWPGYNENLGRDSQSGSVFTEFLSTAGSFIGGGGSSTTSTSDGDAAHDTACGATDHTVHWQRYQVIYLLYINTSTSIFVLLNMLTNISHRQHRVPTFWGLLTLLFGFRSLWRAVKREKSPTSGGALPSPQLIVYRNPCFIVPLLLLMPPFLTHIVPGYFYFGILMTAPCTLLLVVMDYLCSKLIASHNSSSSNGIESSSSTTTKRLMTMAVFLVHRVLAFGLITLIVQVSYTTALLNYEHELVVATMPTRGGLSFNRWSPVDLMHTEYSVRRVDCLLERWEDGIAKVQALFNI